MRCDDERNEFDKALSVPINRERNVIDTFEILAEAVGLEAAVRTYVTEFVSINQENQRTRYRTPVVGFAAADDALWGRLKDVVRSDHYLPDELLPGARTVISIFLPFSREVITGNIGGSLPSREWGTAYGETNDMLKKICGSLAAELNGIGCNCMTDIPPTKFERQIRYGDDLPNRWSQRSIAYIAGIGTFGLHHSIITERGCAGRLTSLITTANMMPTKRPKKEYCPEIEQAGLCDGCIKNCPADVISRGGIDRDLCMEYLYLDVYKKDRGPGCGKCVVDVPCAMEIPHIPPHGGSLTRS